MNIFSNTFQLKIKNFSEKTTFRWSIGETFLVLTSGQFQGIWRSNSHVNLICGGKRGYPFCLCQALKYQESWVDPPSHVPNRTNVCRTHWARISSEDIFEFLSMSYFTIALAMCNGIINNFWKLTIIFFIDYFWESIDNFQNLWIISKNYR